MTTAMTIVMQRNNDYNNNNKGGRQPRQGGPPRGRKIRKEGQGKEVGLASSEEVRRAAIQVNNGNAVFLLMEEMTVMTATALSSAVMLGASLLLGAGTITIIPGLLLLQQHPK
jgi:hypothetical protein